LGSVTVVQVVLKDNIISALFRTSPEIWTMASDLRSTRDKHKAHPAEEKVHASPDSDQECHKPIQISDDQGMKDNVVDWDGPDDPLNPRNWPASKRLLQIIFASAFLLTA
jgi:hypothetical protein